MLHDPVPDTWLWVACWGIALALLLRSDNGVPAVVAPRPVPAPLRARHPHAAHRPVHAENFLAIYFNRLSEFSGSLIHHWRCLYPLMDFRYIPLRFEHFSLREERFVDD
jgi:hypothetical protein